MNKQHFGVPHLLAAIVACVVAISPMAVDARMAVGVAPSLLHSLNYEPNSCFPTGDGGYDCTSPAGDGDEDDEDDENDEN